MGKKLSLLAILLFCVMTLFSFTAVGTPNDIVDIFINQVKVQVDGKNAQIPNLLYDNKTYVSLREISNALDLSIAWDEKTNTAKLSRTSGMAGTLVYLVSKALGIAGALLIAQIVFGRMKKDFYFVKKFNSSNTSLKRLIYTTSTTRVGFYYILVGMIIGFWIPGTGPRLWVRIVFIPVLVLVFWFLGLYAANSISKREQTEILNEE